MSILLSLTIGLCIYISIWFIFSLILKRNDIADIAWGLGFIYISFLSWFFHDTIPTIGVIVTTFVTIWGIRLAVHIYLRNRKKQEDYRYRAWRNEWGKWFYLRSFFQVFLLQGILLCIISTPIVFIHAQDTQISSLTMLQYIGICMWLIGFFFETIGDYQLSQFIKHKKNQGHLLQDGLWKYSRHPNYFGEVTQWWGIWLCAVPFAYGWLTLIGPLTITLLITKISGIPLLEKKFADHPEFPDYAKKTSIFFPRPPKQI